MHIIYNISFLFNPCWNLWCSRGGDMKIERGGGADMCRGFCLGTTVTLVPTELFWAFLFVEYIFHLSDGIKQTNSSDWPGICLFCCYQLVCCQPTKDFGLLFFFPNFINFPFSPNSPKQHPNNPRPCRGRPCQIRWRGWGRRVLSDMYFWEGVGAFVIWTLGI